MMKIARALTICTALVVAAGCTPSDAEGTRDAVSSVKSERENAKTGSKSNYLSDEVIEVGCQIATNYITAQFDKADKPLALYDANGFGHPDLQEDNASRMFAYLIDGENGVPENRAIRERAQAFASLAKQNLFERCPAISQIRVKRSFIPDPNEEARPVTPDGLFFTYDTLQVVLPLVDLDRGQAFMWTATGCGPLCGSGGIEIFTRQPDGSWVRTDDLILWIS